MDDSKRRRRQLVLVAGVVLLILLAIVFMRSISGSSSSSPDPNNGGSSDTPSTTTGTTPQAPEPPQVSLAQKQAVTAAALSTDALAQALFSQPAMVRETVIERVVAQNRTKLVDATVTFGPIQASVWGYDNITAARRNAFYYVSTLKYKVESFNSKRATVWLYTRTHWVAQPGSEYCDTSRPCEYNDPNIIIVDMIRVDGRWMWVNRRNPEPDKVPPPQSDVSFADAEAAFQPYLGGFSTYESVELETG